MDQPGFVAAEFSSEINRRGQKSAEGESRWDGAELVVHRLVGVLGSISFLPPAILPSTFFKHLVGVRSGSGVGEVPSGGLKAAMVGKVEIPSAADAVLWLKYGHPSIYPGW